MDGELLVTLAPTFRHQRAALRLAQLLAPYSDRLGIECVVAPPTSPSPRTVVEPDLFGHPADRREAGVAFRGGGDACAPPSTSSPPPRAPTAT
ncbi:MAG: hypothetical protein IPK33_11165 [Gemmatimonadetes bacterium]|nr:hypothetical protein [Gemmatimonadota bacterium]